MRAPVTVRQRWTVVGAVTVAAGLAAAAVAIQPGGPGPVPATAVAASYDDPLPDVTAEPGDPLVYGISGRLGPAWTGMSSWYTAAHPTMTFSFPVCLSSQGPVTITDLQPLQVIGTDFEVVGTLLHEFELPSEGELTFTGTMRGFPPPGHHSDALHPLIGATVTVACGLPPARSQEVLMGLRATGPDGGGWRGAVLSYTTADGQAHHLVVPMESLMCGRSNEPCGVPED